MTDNPKSTFARRVRAAKARPRKYDVWDDVISGLGLRVGTSGHRSFFLRRTVRGRIRSATIGSADTMTVPQARAEARRLIATFIEPARKDNGPKTPGRPMDAFAGEFLNRYANNRGVPLLLLTDGYRWDFYLSMADGPPEERRFYTLELVRNDDLNTYSQVLETYLGKTHVVSGKSRRQAEERLCLERQRTRARKAISRAWNALLNEPDELLCELLSDKVRTHMGTSPDTSDVEGFIARVARASAPSSEVEELRKGTASAASPPRSHEKSSPDGGKLQDVIYDLMCVVLEIHPEVLNSDTIRYLECSSKPFGTKLSYPLIRKTSKGRFINNGQARYKKDVFGEWHVTTEWNKKNHDHNATMLAKWVKSLIDGASDEKARNSLVNIFDRISSYTEK